MNNRVNTIHRWMRGASRVAAAMAILLVLIAGRAAADESKHFSVQSSDIFPPGKKPYVNLNAYNVKNVEVRVYKLTDPVMFFKNQTNFHSPNPNKVGKKISPSELVDEFNSTVKSRYRNLLQSLSNEDARKTAVEDFNIRLDGPKKKAVKNYPLLSEKKGYKLVATFNYRVKNSKKESYDYERVDLPIKDKGVYLVEAVTPEMAAYSVALVTGMRFIDKTSSDSKLIYVCDGKSGRPIADAEVLFIQGYMGQEPTAVKTDQQGIAKFKREAGHDVRYLVKKGDDFIPGDPYYYESYESGYKAYVYTERPVYRPGHTVNFKAIMRNQKGRDYEVMAGREAMITIYDDNYDKVLETSLKTNDMGTVSGSFKLGDEPSLGKYSIEISVDENTAYGSFKVEEYKKPEYLVDVKTTKGSYIAGDEVTADISANYYFGEPVGNAKVEYFVYTSRYYIPWWREYGNDSQYSWYYSDEEYETYGDQKLLEKGEGELDDNGKLRVVIPGNKVDYDAVYRIVAKVTDKARHEIEGQAMVKVARGLYSIDTHTERYSYAKGAAVKVGVTTKTITGKAVSTTLHYELIRSYYVENTKTHWIEKTQNIKKGSIKTNSKGEAVLTYTAGKSGYYELKLSGKDARGNSLDETNSVYIYEEGGGWYYSSSSDSIKIIPDKKGYKEGETAKLIITSPVQNATMLITVEGPQVFESKVVTVQGSNYLYELSVKPEYAPNVFVKATIVSNMDYFEGEQEIAFPPTHKFLNITLDTDKKIYKPGEPVRVTINVKDSEGNPVDAEISAGIVDEAIYAIAQESTPDIRKFFYGKEWNKVQTDFSYEFYTYGYSKTLAQHLASLDRRIARGDLKGDERVNVRKDFRDTMHWEPTLRSGPEGKIEFTAKCPDNLTTWRITVRAVDAKTRVAEETLKFREKKDVIVRLAAPRFFREKDTVVLATTVHNYLDSEKTFKVSLEADGLLIEPSGSRLVKIPKGGNKRLDWRAQVYPGIRNVRVTASATAPGGGDAMQLTIPFLPFGMQMTKTDFTEVAGKAASRNLDLAFPDGTELKNSTLRVEVAPSIASGIFSSLDYLISYPYGCVEQTMSSFLPNVIVSQAIKGSPVKNEDRFKKLPDMVAKGLKRLYDYQHSDGGWGWWQDDETHPFMTAYVVYGFVQAKLAGYEVSESAYQRGVQSLINQLKSTELDPTTRLYMAYALTLTGSNDGTIVKAIYKNRNAANVKMNNYSRALLTMALNNLALKKEAATVANEIIKNTATNGGAHWEGLNWHYSWQDDSYETTAQCVRALAAVKPGAKQIKGAIRWLISHRQGGNHWRSTRDTAVIVMALLDYSRTTGELSAGPLAKVSINGGKARTKQFTKNDAFSEPWVIEYSANDLRLGNKLNISRAGGGALYVTVTRTYYTAGDTIPAMENGFSVTRTYQKITAKRSGDEWVYEPEDIVNHTVYTGDEILVTVNIGSDDDNDYFMLEDFIPAGCEVVKDTQGYKISGVNFTGTNYGDSWYSFMDIRDEKVAFFTPWFWRGRSEVMYIMRAELPGTYHAMPAVATRMYFPEVAGNSDDYLLTIDYKE